MVEPGRLRVTKGPKENRFRPAIDPLFRSAQVYGRPAELAAIREGIEDSLGLPSVERAEEAHRQPDLFRKLVNEREPLAAINPN